MTLVMGALRRQCLPAVAVAAALWLSLAATAVSYAQVPSAPVERWGTFLREVDALLATGDISSLLGRTDRAVPWRLGQGRLVFPTAAELTTHLAAVVPAGSQIALVQSDVWPEATRAFFLTEPGPLYWEAERSAGGGRRGDGGTRTWRIVKVEPFRASQLFYALTSLAQVNFRLPDLVPDRGEVERLAFLDRGGRLHVVTFPAGQEAVYEPPRPWPTPLRVAGWAVDNAVVLETQRAERPELWHVRLATQTWTLLGNFRRATVSPDGRWLLYEAPPIVPSLSAMSGHAMLQDLAALDRPPRPLPGVPFPEPIAWRPDGGEVLVGGFVVSTSSGRTRRSPFRELFDNPEDRPALGCSYRPSWSPDGTLIAGLVPVAGASQQVQPVVVAAAGGVLRRLAAVALGGVGRGCIGAPPLPWLADGSAVHFATGTAAGWVLVPLTGEEPVALGGEAITVPGQPPAFSRVVDVSPQGQALHLIPTQLGSVQSVGVSADPLAEPRDLARGQVESAAFSPTGRWVVTVEWDQTYVPRRWWYVRDVNTGEIIWQSNAPLPGSPLRWHVEALPASSGS